MNREENIRAIIDSHFAGFSEEIKASAVSSIISLQHEPSGDAISRQAAIDAIENEQKKIMRSDWDIDQAKFSAMSEIRALIAELPSVSTEKTGEWIEKTFGIERHIQCSICGESFNTINKSNYCPNCGAKMGVEE